MSAEVIHPFPASPPPREPIQDVIDVIEDVLERARAGEVVGVAIAWVEPEKSIVSTWSGTSVSANLMVSATAQLAARVMRTHLDDE